MRAIKFRKFRFGMRTLLFVIAILAIVFAMYGHHERQKLRPQRALTAMTDKGVDAHFDEDMNNIVIKFKNGNVTDDDLKKFMPALEIKSGIPGFGRVTELQLFGSNVSEDALDTFRESIPWCKITR